MITVVDGSQTAEYCPRCGAGIEWLQRREVMVPREGVVDQPWRWMPCGCFVNPADEPLPRPRQTWTAE